jgi:hypothetical protein
MFLVFPGLYRIIHQLKHCLKEYFLQNTLATRKDSKPETKEWHAQILAEGAKLFIGVANVNQSCV